MNLGEKIKNRRLELDLTLEEVGKLVGVAKSTVMKWENEDIENMRRDKIVLLADALRVSPLWIMGIEEDEDMNVDTVDLPIVGQISCGNGILVFEEILGHERTPKDWLNGGEYFYLKAKGDSMTGARINNGDLLLIRKQPDVENGEIAAVLIDNEDVMLKRFYRNNGQLVLQSENPKYPPIVSPPKEVSILGKLIKIVISL